MAEVPQNSNNHNEDENTANKMETTNSSVLIGMSTTEQPLQQINVVDDATLQQVLTSMTEPEMNAFLEELNKNGKAYLPGLGQTIELLTVPSAPDSSTMTSLAVSQATQSQSLADSILQELKTFIQQAPADIMPMPMEQKHVQPSVHSKAHTSLTGLPSRPTRTANTYGGTPVIGGSARPGTAVKSTVTASGGATIRKSFPQQSTQDDRMFFGRPTTSVPTTIGQGQYQNRQQPMSSTSSMGQQRRVMTSTGIETQQQQLSSQRRPLSWFQNRSRRHSSGDEVDSDLDSSPPPYSMSGSDNLGPTRRSQRVPKPKQDADFVTFPLLDRDEHGNPIPPTPSSMPLNKAEDDEDDIPYRLMDYPRPSQQSQSATVASSTGSPSAGAAGGPGRKQRTAADMRTTSIANKKQPRWPDDELYHVKSFVPLIMPQQITNPSTMKNKTTMCKPLVAEREVEAKPTRFTIATQTEMEHMIPDVPLVTLPVPIYLPSPTPSYRLFRPRAVPIPVPFFVPIMIPVPRKAFKNIQEYLQKQRDLLPDDPFEAALIMHAESLVRAENQPQPTTTVSTQENLMMMDISRENSYLTTSQMIENLPELDLETHYIDPMTSNDSEVQKLLQMLPDASDRLKWTYGVQAFQQWCEQRNRTVTTEELDVSKEHLIKSDLLSYTNVDELQQVMSFFIQEVRRSTGELYLPESIYYLCLGIQFYLNMNNRQIDLFDPRHVAFSSTLNKILLNHSPRVLSGSNIRVSLIDEDLLYDAQQLGILTPWTLLTTLIYTNTKNFNLKTVDGHVTISFANFGKYSQWVRLPTSAPQGQQMQYLRFYAHNPDLKLLANAPTVYEITEHSQDPARCPIKQFDFYVSKCPEQVRNAADVFYLCPLNEPPSETNSLWYSTETLSATVIDQILNRLKLLPDFDVETKPVETGSTPIVGSTNVNMN